MDILILYRYMQESSTVYTHAIHCVILYNLHTIQWIPVIRTSLGIAYNVLVTGMSYRMDIANKNTLGSKKYVRITV